MYEYEELETAIYQERERYREEDIESPRPIEINDGLCRMFARRVRDRVLMEVTIEQIGFNDTSYPAHAWIKYEDRFFDAEVPEGVKSREELPFFRRNEIKEVNTEKIETFSR
jgi:hypothetical protein